MADPRETSFYVDPTKRSIVLPGLAADKIYNLAVRGYRRVDKDISASGVIFSELTRAKSWRYQPSATVAFNGDVTGTIQGVASSQVIADLVGLTSDGVLSRGEKATFALAYTQMAATYDAASSKSVQLGGTDSQRSAAFAAVNALNDYLGTLRPAWNDMTVDTPIDPDTFRAAWATVQATVADLQAAVTDRASQLAKWTGVTGPGKPQDNATVGAPVGTNVGDVPVTSIVDAVKGLDGSVLKIRDISSQAADARTAAAAASSEAAAARQDVVNAKADLKVSIDAAQRDASSARSEAAQVGSDLAKARSDLSTAVSAAQGDATAARTDISQARSDLAAEVQRAKEDTSAIRRDIVDVKQTADGAASSIRDEAAIRSRDDSALTTRISSAESEYRKANDDRFNDILYANGRINDEQTTRANADSALANRSAKIEASVAGVSKVVANDYFDNGVEGWTLLDGVAVAPSSYGRSSVIRTQPGQKYNEVRGRKIAITSDKQRFKLKASWRCAAAQSVYYFGVVFYDADGNHVGASDGTGNYPLAPGIYVKSEVDSGWIDREVIIGKGYPAPSPYGGTTSIPAGAVYFRQIIFINYTDIPGSVTEIDYFAVEDVTEAVATNALIADEATTRATTDTALSGRLSTTEAKLNGDQDSALAARIRDEATASVNRDSALASRASTIESNFERAERGNLPPNFDGGDNDWDRNVTGRGSSWVYYEDTRPKSDWSKTDSTVVTGVHAAGGYLYLFPRRSPIPVSSGDVVRLYASVGAYGDCDAQVYFDTRDRAGNVTPNSFSGGMTTPVGFGNNKAGNNRYDVICCEYRVPDGVSAIVPSFVSNANGYAGPIFVRWMKFEVAGASSKLGALITDESTTRANADSALGSRVSTTEAKLNGDQDSTLAARIRDEATASVNRDGALASRTNTLEASASAATASLNPNPTFSMWPDGQTLPAGMTWWNRGSSTVSRTSSTLGRGGYSLLLDSVDGQESGLGWDNIYNTPGWYVLEADCWLQSGRWEGSGVTLGGTYSIDFLRDPDTNGGVGEVSYGGVRRFTKLINFTDQTYRTFHPMNHWNGFSQNARAKSMIWLRAAIRPATAGEILAQKANATADNAQARISDEASARTNADSAISGRLSTTEAKLNGDQDSTLAARIRDEATASANRDSAITNRTAALESTASRVADMANKTFPGFEVQADAWGYETQGRNPNTGSVWEPYHVKGAGIAFPPGFGNYLYMNPYGWIKTTPGKRYRAGFWVWQWSAPSGYGGNARVYWEGNNQGHTNGAYLGSSSNPPEATQTFYSSIPNGAWHCYASDIFVDDAMVADPNSFWIRPRINIDNVPANAGYVIAGWFFREVTGEFSNAAKITDEATTRADQTSALANRASALETSVNNGATGNLALQTKISNEETARSNADTALATRSTILEAAATNAGNLVPNSAFTTLDGWFVNYAANGGFMERNRAGPGYQIGGIENNLCIYQAPAGNGLQAEVLSEKFALRDGEYYQVQALTSNHRCRAWIALFFYNSNNDMIGYTGENFGARINAGGQSVGAQDITGAKSVRAPDGTVYGRFAIRIYDVSNDGYVWVHRPYVGVVKPNTDQWNAYSPGNDRTVLVQTNAKIADEATTRANADSAISSRVSTTEAKLNGDQDSTLAARIREEATARVGAYDALAGRSSSLESKMEGNQPSGLQTLIKNSRKNLIDVGWWRQGNAPQWPLNGGQRNEIVQFPHGGNFDAIPLADGSSGDAWLCQADGSGGAAGGWQSMSTAPLDPDKTYRFAVPIAQLGGAGQRTAYWGTENVAGLNSTDPYGNPYFAVASNLIPNRWYLFVGYIFPRNSTGKSHAGAGVWDMVTGEQFTTGQNFNFRPDGLPPQHRAYQYYAYNGSYQAFGRPMVELVDGTETPFPGTLAATRSASAANARISNEETTRANADSAIAGRTSTLEANYNRLPEKFRVVCSGNAATSGLIVGAGIYNGAGQRWGDYNRSYTVIVFQMNSNVISNVDSYDVYGNDQHRQAMANWLNAIEAGRTVVIYTADEPMTGRFERGLGDAMARVGAGEDFFSPSFRSHSAYILIGRAGVGRGGGMEFYQGDTDVSPQAFLDIKFDMVQGRPNLGTGKTAVVLNAKISDEANARANADSALASRTSKIEANYNVVSGGEMSANSRFSNWPDGQRNPTGWGDWVSEGNYTITRQGGISGSPYSVYTQHNANAECGFYQVVSTWAGKWVVEVTARRDAGSLSGSGVTLSGIYNIDFLSDPDINGQVRDSNDGETRTWVKTFDVTQTSLNLHAMAGWSGFGRARASNYITWFKLSLRPAGPGDIAGVKNAADIVAANARINDEATARSNADGALSNRLSTTEAQISGGQDSWLAARIRDEASASASRDNAISSRTSIVEAQVSNDSNNLLRNGTFNAPGWGPGSAGPPPNWRVWAQDNGAYIGASDRTSAYGARAVLQIDRNGINNGVAQDVPGPLAPGWYAFEVDVTGEDGNWSGSGVHCNFNNGSSFNFGLATNNDTAERFGDIGNAARRFTWLFYNPQQSNGATLYLMAGWSGFQGDTNFGFVRTLWHRIVMRPATAGEIQARKVADSNLIARVSQTESAVANINGKVAAYWQVQAVAGNNRAQMTVHADANGGAGVDIVGDVRFSGGNANGTCIVNGNGLNLYYANGQQAVRLSI
ncbi:MAG TPA: hypothetical protein H9899_07540 [Candidatus Sphingomonas excrementigallinarum]|nr:hypothetical protein [Candidatus Sphingomonas excrementigallinarum]